MREMSDVESDGRRLDRNINIPESENVHIPAGNSKRETYRLSTYHHFPLDVPIDPRRFARQGFYFTGYRNRVVCFSCKQAAESWTAIDDIRERRWHRDDCDFMNGRDAGNEPIGNLFSNQGTTDDFLPTFLPIDEASSASNTLQSQSETSFTNNIFQSQSENTDVERSHIETPHFCTENSQVPFPSSATQNEPLHPTRPSSSTTLLLETFPCSHPINPHMRSKEARLQTFLDNSTRWPAHRIRATPQQIVDAGMYYLGLRDRVKCWYCNGGLQNWDEEDDPWAEHAKWFPLCEFVLQQKGPEFVHRIVSLYPGLERPPLYNPTRAEPAREIAQQMHFSANSVSYQQTHSSVLIIDPQEEIRQRNENIEMEMKTSIVVPEARKMGFDDKMIKNAIKKHYQGNSQTFTSIEPLIEALVNLECESPEENSEEHSISAAATYSNNELQALEESRMCKKCRKQEACVVFIPCGHLVCCADCAQLSYSCRICGEVIREKVRSFLS